MTFRDRLRDLPVFGPSVTGWDVDDLDALPAAPQELFVAWFDEAVAEGAVAPHAMTLSTASTAGHVRARTVILKDLDDDGWWFAGHDDSPKGRDLADNPRAALTFLWRETGRQVRVSGTVTSRPDVGAADFRARPDASRATGLVGRQSEPLASLGQHRAAWADALDEVRADPWLVAPTWTAWVLDATEVQFWATGAGTGQTRVRYRRSGASWATDLLWP